MSAKRIYKHIDSFTDIKDAKAPHDKILTVFCDDGNEEVGFAEDIMFEDLGLSMFIAKKWILQEDINQLIESEVQK